MDDAIPSVHPNADEHELEVLRSRLTQEAATILEIHDEGRIKALGQAIRDAHETYLIAKGFRDLVQSPKAQKKKLAKLSDQIAKTVESLREIQAVYLVAIGDIGQNAAPHRLIDVVSLIDDLQQLGLDVSHFLDVFEPTRGKPGNLALETAVRVLLPVVEDLTAGKVLVSENKNSGVSAEPRSNSARAIVAILRQFEEPPFQSSILNMITKVQRNPEHKNAAIDAIMRAQQGSLPVY